MVGRLWDLASAYKQLARTPAHASLAIVAVWNPRDKRTEYYKQVSLPFGASASVLGFNWVACALCLCLLKLLAISASNFYDDFTVFELEALAGSATESVESFFAILGWELKPLRGFSSTPEPLGAIVDLRDARRGVCRITNNPSASKNCAALSKR